MIVDYRKQKHSYYKLDFHDNAYTWYSSSNRERLTASGILITFARVAKVKITDFNPSTAYTRPIYK